MAKWQNAPINVFYSYAPEDEGLRHSLEKHLSLLRHQGVLSDWHEHKISAGSDRAQSIDRHLATAALILLLISPDFMASDYSYSVEMQRALDLHEAGKARVIPVILRPVDWRSAPFAHLQCLPRDQKPVTQWSDADEAFLAITEGIREAIETISGPPVHASPRSATKQEQQNRQRFLKRVHTVWITGVLERSLYNATLITLGLSERQDTLANPWHLLVQETDAPPCPMPAGTGITQVYDDADGRLLILGDPGAGKTTLLLELARALLQRAEHSGEHPLPAVFNLSSWAQKRQPLASWLIEELHDKYQVPRNLGASWIASDQLLPLLDGLDEVAQTQRSACIAAINHYQQEHPSLVLCSRSAEYLDQAERVSLQKSVSVQPLTMQQIDEYLSLAGEQLAALRLALQDDVDLQELATTPLMLNILMLTYQGKDDLIAIKSPKLRRQQVFEQYVQRMFQRRSAQKSFAFKQTNVWLMMLAQQMKRHNQTQFYIERLQMDWLIYSKSILLYRGYTILVCILVGTFVGLATSLLIGERQLGLSSTLLITSAFGLSSGLMGGLQPGIQLPEGLSWSWNVILQRWPNVPLFMLVGGLIAGVGTKFVAVLAGILLGALFGILFNVLMYGLAEGMAVIRNITTPNQEIRRAARNSLLVILFGTPFFLLFIALNNWLAILMISGFMLAGGLGFGGLACIQHIILRFLLWRSGQLPWDLPRFLDYAAERILLRKVGGGYIFIHRLLLDYFASLDEALEGN